MFRRLNAIRKTVDFRAATVAGLAAGTAYVAMMEIDTRLSGKKLDDLILLGWPLVKDKRHAKAAGVAPHLVNSVLLAMLYGATGARKLPGPGWFRGLVST